jgi:hypothetical protein
MKRAISTIVAVSIAAILIAVAGLGTYVAYSSGDLFGATTSSTQGNCISLSEFSLDAETSNVSGTVLVNGRSPLTQMDLYINSTYMGSRSYTGMSSGSYSMMYYADPQSMPQMSSMPMTAGRSYMISMTAMFSDGSHCTASSVVVGEAMITTMMSTYSQSMMSSSGMMFSSSAQIVSSGMIYSSSTYRMTTTQMMNSSSNMMGR